LHARELRLIGADVLHKDEFSVRSKDAMKLSQRARLIVDSAKHERANNRVEAVVVEGKVFG